MSPKSDVWQGTRGPRGAVAGVRGAAPSEEVAAYRAVRLQRRNEGPAMPRGSPPCSG